MYILSSYMKFPITRESLQAFDQTKEEAEQKKELIQDMLEKDITEICSTVKRGMPEYSREKRMIWQTSKCLNGERGYYPRISMDEYLPRLIEKLQETFVGCDIIMDPLQTYIVISWY